MYAPYFENVGSMLGLRQVWGLIASVPDHCPISYFVYGSVPVCVLSKKKIRARVLKFHRSLKLSQLIEDDKCIKWLNF